MSEKGLLESEKLADGVTARVKKSLRQQRKELQLELDKVKYLLGDTAQARAWANSLADNARKQALLNSLTDVEKLYLQAGDSEGARIFKQRFRKQLNTKLTNLRANELEVDIKIAKSKLQSISEITSGLSNIKREGALKELFDQSRSSGGFFANFGRSYLNDLITLETKAAGSKTLGEYMENLYNTYEQGLKDVFVKGIVRGDSYELMQKNLMKTTDITEGKAKLLVRTEANAIFNESIKDAIQDNPLVKGYRFRAVLDSKTSSICRKHDGNYIPKNEIKPGVNFPPLHPNCRSTVTTVLVSENEKKDTMQRYTKNNRNQWEKVPVGMTYEEFKDKFGFSNSKNPKTYNASTRSIHDKTLAQVTQPKYKGYVKPSISAVGRIDDLIKAYVEDDLDYQWAVKQNTGENYVRKAILRQAQAESGFDGLPLKQSAKDFEKEVTKNGYKRVYRKFGEESDLESFLTGSQDYLDDDGGAFGTKAYSVNKGEAGVVEMALKTTPEKTLRLANKAAIKQCATSDARINDLLAKVPENKRPAVFNIAAMQYGYDVAEFQQEGFDAILNRTAVIVKAPDPPPVAQPTTQLANDLNRDIRNRRPILQNREEYDKVKKAAISVPRTSSIADVERLTSKLTTAEGMDEEPSRLLRRYTGASYKDFNGYCREVYAKDIHNSYGGFADNADELAAALYKKTIGQDINLFRKTTELEFQSQLDSDSYSVLKQVLRAESQTEADELLTKFKTRVFKGDEPFTLRTTQFESTSVKPGSYGDSKNVALNFLAKSDTPGAYINAVSEFKDREFEALLPPGVKYAIRDIRATYKDFRVLLDIDAEICSGVYEVPDEFSRTLKVIMENSKEA